MLHLRVVQDDHDHADLLLSRRLLHPDLAALPASVVVAHRRGETRQRIEAFIRGHFARRYGARMRVDYPTLIGLQDRHEAILAAVGVRPAQLSQLFLEAYLDRPVEVEIGRLAERIGLQDGRAIERRQIVEVGNLAAAGNGAVAILYAALAELLHHAEYAAVVITGPQSLARQLRRVGIGTVTLGPARAAALGAAAASWGSYYEADPQVLAGAIAPGVRALRDVFGTRYLLRAPSCLPPPRRAVALAVGA